MADPSSGHPVDDFGIGHFLQNFQRPAVAFSISDFPTPQDAYAFQDRQGSFSSDATTSSSNQYPSGSRSRSPSPGTVISSSTATYSRGPSTVFDRTSRTSRSGRYTDSVHRHSNTTIDPPAPLPSFLEQFAGNIYGVDPQSPAAAAAPGQRSKYLWCEFAVVKGCQATFALDDFTGWYEHHLLHLQYQVPKRCGCLFCNHVRFPSRQFPLQGLANFELRMEHIHQHMLDEEPSVRDMRPDFEMLDHLERIGVISKQERRAAGGYNEIPVEFRLPGTSNPWDMTPRAAPELPRERGVPDNLEQENRRLKRARGRARH